MHGFAAHPTKAAPFERKTSRLSNGIRFIAKKHKCKKKKSREHIFLLFPLNFSPRQISVSEMILTILFNIEFCCNFNRESRLERGLKLPSPNSVWTLKVVFWNFLRRFTRCRWWNLWMEPKCSAADGCSEIVLSFPFFCYTWRKLWFQPQTVSSHQGCYC